MSPTNKGKFKILIKKIKNTLEFEVQDIIFWANFREDIGFLMFGQ